MKTFEILSIATPRYAYGTSELGGTAGHGTIFKMTAKGVVNILHSFGDGSVPNDGYSPRTILMTDPDHNCYGTTSSGPQESGKPESKGTLFRITPKGKLTILHRFGDGTVPNDGNASGQVGFYTGSIDDTFYGTTEFEGAANNGGTFFKFTAKGGFAVLHAFGDHTWRSLHFMLAVP